jgi:hypothetical protein
MEFLQHGRDQFPHLRQHGFRRSGHDGLVGGQIRGLQQTAHSVHEVIHEDGSFQQNTKETKGKAGLLRSRVMWAHSCVQRIEASELGVML